MDVFWKFVEFEPCNLVKLVRLTISDFFSVNADLEIKCHPVCGFSIVDTMNVPITEKFIIQNIRTILLLNFLTDGLVNGFPKLQPATADVPSSVLVPRVAVAFCHNELTFSVMTKVHHTNTNMVYSFYQIFSHNFNLLSLRQNDLSFLMKSIKNIIKRQLKTKKKLCKFLYPSIMIKKFSFLLSKSPIHFCPENPIQISRRARQGEPKLFDFSYVVPRRGLEPPWVTPLAPKASTSTNFATSAVRP